MRKTEIASIVRLQVGVWKLVKLSFLILNSGQIATLVCDSIVVFISNCTKLIKNIFIVNYITRISTIDVYSLPCFIASKCNSYILNM